MSSYKSVKKALDNLTNPYGSRYRKARVQRFIAKHPDSKVHKEILKMLRKKEQDIIQRNRSRNRTKG